MTTDTSDVTSAERRTPIYQLFMLALCVIALAGMVAQYAFAREPEVRSVLDVADNVICIAFAIDFLVSLWRAPNRMRYFLTWGWLDLLSSIPTLDVGRWGRLARIARIARVLRSIRAARMLSAVILRRRRDSTLLAATLLALVLIVASSAAILQFEMPADGNIKTAEKAIWWAFATITTVGYGDVYPVTTEGRVIAVLLMVAGVGLFGTFSAALAAWFLHPEEQATDAEISGLREEVQRLREAVEKLAQPRG